MTCRRKAWPSPRLRCASVTRPGISATKGGGEGEGVKKMISKSDREKCSIEGDKVKGRVKE